MTMNQLYEVSTTFPQDQSCLIESAEICLALKESREQHCLTGEEKGQKV